MSATLRSALLSDVCRFQNGGTPSKSVERYFTGDIPWITGADLVGPVALQARSFITEEAIASSATNQVSAGTVLLVTRTSVGKVAIAGMSLCFSQDITALTPDPKKLDAGYLVQFLRTKESHFAKHARGATIQGITRQVVADLSIPLPPLEEQRRIAAILEQAETLRTQRRAALAHLDSLTQSLFLDMFGDPVTNPKEWSRHTLGDLIAEGPQNGLYKPSTDYGSGTPILRIDAFYDGVVTKLNTLKRVRLSADDVELFGLQAEDIVINRVNSIEYLGKSALIPTLSEPTVFESNMMRFKVKRDHVDPGYIVHFLQTGYIKGQILSGSKNAVNQSSINQQDVKGFRFNVPPLPLQQTFATRIQAIESLKAIHRAALAELDALFASLQHRAFTGEL